MFVSALWLALPGPSAQALGAPPQAQVACALASGPVTRTMTASGPAAWGASGTPPPRRWGGSPARAVPPCRQLCRVLPRPHSWPDPSHWCQKKPFLLKEKKIKKKKKKSQTAAEIL